MLAVALAKPSIGAHGITIMQPQHTPRVTAAIAFMRLQTSAQISRDPRKDHEGGGGMGNHDPYTQNE